MIVKGLKINNYKNIEVLDVELDPHSNIIAGKNGAGKSSVVNAMIDAIVGKTEMGKVPQRKIKKGKDSATIEVTLEDPENGNLVIQRKITQKDVYLKAHREDGQQVKQTDLANLLDKTTINISKLLFMEPKEQVDFIKEVAGIDTTEVENKYREKYSERTVLNRQLKEAESTAKSLEVEPVEPVVVGDILKEIEAAEEANREAERREHEISVLEDAVSDSKAYIQEAEERIRHYEQAIAQLKEQIASKNDEIKESTRKVKAIKKKPVPEKIDLEPLRERIRAAEETNQRANAYKMYVEAKRKAEEAKKAVENINAEMRALLEEREKIISSSKLPFKNIGLDKELGLTIDGVPFSEMSTAQQIRVMSRIYIESNPKLKVVYIQDGSLLDSDTLSQITEMSDMKDFQFLIEVVGEEDADIVMREGRLASEADDDLREDL